MTESELHKLIAGWLDGRITPKDHARLQQELKESQSARRVYHECLTVHAELTNRSAADRHLQSMTLFEDDSTGETTPAVTRNASPRAYAAALAAVSLAIAASVAWLLFPPGKAGEQDPDTVAQKADEKDSGVTAQTGATWYVAQIIGMTSEVRWGAGVDSQEFLLRFRIGDKLVLEEGLVELEYYTGARVVLNGPCEYVVTGDSSGRLASGSLSGNVTQGDFILTTPSAEVIDLGTAFGVTLDPSGNTEVFVVDGKVSVSDSLAGPSKSSQLLEEGMAARIPRTGGVEVLDGAWPKTPPQSLPTDKSTVDVAQVGEVSLVDLLSGVRDDRFRLAGVIAPDTGESDRHPWLRAEGPGHSLSHGYQVTEWHPFVDGVFIPAAVGTATQIDSEQHRVDLPGSLGTTWGPVWSRRRSDHPEAVSNLQDYWGTDTLTSVGDRLKDCRSGMIGMHANVGVTFDLQAIEKQWDLRPTKLRGMTGNLDNSLAWTDVEWAKQHRFSASLRVFIDGELRFSRLDFAREDGEISIETELKPGDRFLTIVSTDAMDVATAAPDAFDHVVLIDPVLELSPR
ncbi:FecR protein [Planctomycetes bacterium MalM25]|nr:FecR protein [Planctomycetes bacterium MalM25]